jgi:metallo-beta-lactamase family protein
VDCGLFQGSRDQRQLNWQAPPFDPAELQAVVLTHAHIDHIGFLPRLVRQGYQGPVYTTAPTGDLARISLLDSANIQEEDAAYRNRKRLTRHKEALPLFTTNDAGEALNLVKPVLFNNWIPLTDNTRMRLHVAGHVLGAAGVEIQADDNGRRITLFFSGDVGRYGNPLTINPAEPPGFDYLVCESTYGGRLHEPEDPRAVFIELVNEVVKNKRVLLIPAFAVDRTQQIVFLINELIRHRLIPEIDIHIDSPMAVSATDIYSKHHSYHSVDISNLSGSGCILEGKNVYLHRKRRSSKVLNKLKGPAVIISASGMLTGGRILHHLLNRLNKSSTTVALAGSMAQGTPGRRLTDGATELRIHKQVVEVKARIVQMNGLSGHADFYEILHWLEPVAEAPKRVFITHGETEQSQAMAEKLRTERGWDCYIPALNEAVEL